MSSVITIIVALAVLVLLNIYCWIRDWHKRQLRYSLKLSLNSIRPILHITWALYACIGGVAVTPSIVKWASEQEHQSWVLDTISHAWVITIMIVMLMIIQSGYKPFIKYTEEELEWQREKIKKMREKLPSFLRRFIKEPK